ncbi:plasmid partitioning protein RepB [Phyllobacterium endophyticum]|uniref:Plasmid partitioning protein RepB n=1 Tax=Phyllobacterium endophyticum TaxID=1149773 RepID=A0A2P7AK95_9HYPH|nr:plasmid partitioning protein RepB [Phyllobacterium endophyticum]MBB3237138.1 ParB family chromosome partitioning protein [Phyllobacterium endophyticum]PSH54634.1 plasmid partitioning protein RepB [Phyllobacterium endophyticum]TYR40598.1 plasmid partitioning protein RepB [Phyllobacterium endophyticum]
MARKNVLLGITQAETAMPERTATSGYAARGASRSMLNSIGELAAQAAKAERLLEGETVVDLDPDLIDGSFVSDRMEDNAEAFSELVTAIDERGQDSPILVRPHPTANGRYQIVFGHRRFRAAKELGRPVRAVVKELDDKDHVVAQGQENSARENLSFIERAVFAQKLTELGHSRETVQSSLSIDAPMLTRMLSVTKRIPASIIQSIGAAKGVGRDRWLEMTVLIDNPSNLVGAGEFIATDEFMSATADSRFDLLFKFLKTARKTKRAIRSEPKTRDWAPADKSVSVTSKAAGKVYTLNLKDKDAGVFGGWLSENLERFYQEFRESEKVKKTGD